MRVAGKVHREGGRMSALLVRAVETLALAVEAYGAHPPDRLESVRVKAHALAIGRLMGLDPKDLDALLKTDPSIGGAIAAAPHEERSIAALRDELGNSLSLHETLSGFDAGLKRLVSYDCIAVYLPRKERLAPAYVNGADSRLFCSLEIPYGQGPSGRAASTRQPVLNQDPSAEGDYATLAVPLESGGELIGVLALYHALPGVFGAGDLRTLLSLRAKLARAMENALKHERAEQVSAVDPLTALSNGRGLFLRLDADLARCRRNHAGLAVVVCHVAGLKQVQQRFGPLACAPLHQSIANGLRRICREDDCVARLEDEFVLVLGGFQARDLEEKRKLIESLLDEIGDADLGARVLAPRLGAAFYPEDGAYAEDLLAAAGSRLNPPRPPVGQASWPVLPVC